MPHSLSPSCPTCGVPTTWQRCSLPNRGVVTHSYTCAQCSSVTKMTEPDPAQQAKGWLNGELKPPM